MKKNIALNRKESLCPEEDLRQLSFYEDYGVNSQLYSLPLKVKKISIIEGWVRDKEKKEEPLVERKPSLLQNYRKMLRPNSSITRSHYTHIAFAPTQINISQADAENISLPTHRFKRRPMSSTLRRVNHFQQIKTPSQSSSSTKRTQHEYLKKHCGIRNSKKNLEKDKKITVESFTYPLFDIHFHNPQKLIPNIGRISYLVKAQKKQDLFTTLNRC